jgi:hypothetical protein
MHHLLEDFPYGLGVLRRCARHQDPAIPFINFLGDGGDVLGRFACPENHFREPFAKPAVGIHLGKPKIRDRRSLKGLEHSVASNLPFAEPIQQSQCF